MNQTERTISHDTGIAKGIIGEIRREESNRWTTIMAVPPFVLASTFLYTATPPSYRTTSVVVWGMAVAFATYAHQWKSIGTAKKRAAAIRTVQLAMYKQQGQDTQNASDAVMGLHHELLGGARSYY